MALYPKSTLAKKFPNWVWLLRVSATSLKELWNSLFFGPNWAWKRANQQSDEAGVPVVEGEHGVEEVRDQPGPRPHRQLPLLQRGDRVAHGHRHPSRRQRLYHLWIWSIQSRIVTLIFTIINSIGLCWTAKYFTPNFTGWYIRILHWKMGCPFCCFLVISSCFPQEIQGCHLWSWNGLCWQWMKRCVLLCGTYTVVDLIILCQQNLVHDHMDHPVQNASTNFRSKILLGHPVQTCPSGSSSGAMVTMAVVS